MFLPVLTGGRCLQHRTSILTFFAILRQLIWTSIRRVGREKLITDLFLSHLCKFHVFVYDTQGVHMALAVMSAWQSRERGARERGGMKA